MNNTDAIILRTLLEKENGFVSGTYLAGLLDMSRVAVWQHMERMRKIGFEFEAVRARGYRIAKRPNKPHCELIEAHLAGRQLSIDLECIEEVDSTNDQAARYLAEGRAAPFVILASRQTKGRGRFGRVWHSEPNGNLYASFAFRPQLEPARMQMFTLWMGVNVCELIANFARTTPGLKWPNDILFDGRKAGGMLTEARMDADQIRDLVFGIGLNLNSPAEAWPDDLGRRAVSLAEHTQAPVDLNKFAAALIGRIHDAYDQFIKGTHTQTFADRWNRYDVLRGKNVTLLHGTQRIEGLASGIDDEGSLLLRTERGKMERFRAGEVTLEKKAAARA